MMGQRIASLRTKLSPSTERALTISGVPAQHSAATMAPSTPAPSAPARPKFLDESICVISARVIVGRAQMRRLSSFQPRAAVHRAVLHRRTSNRPIRAEHAAIAGFRCEQYVAIVASVKEHARGDGHHQLLGMSTLWAGQYGSELHTRRIYLARALTAGLSVLRRAHSPHA